jgi:hypothetical protein
MGRARVPAVRNGMTRVLHTQPCVRMPLHHRTLLRGGARARAGKPRRCIAHFAPDRGVDTKREDTVGGPRPLARFQGHWDDAPLTLYWIAMNTSSFCCV